ncbi:MAG: LUD domain-containing protein [Nitrososphaeria archaeon]|nr:LUD domain-containing protein [Conexivisphaerales archaeon]
MEIKAEKLNSYEWKVKDLVIDDRIGTFSKVFQNHGGYFFAVERKALYDTMSGIVKGRSSLVYTNLRAEYEETVKKLGLDRVIRLDKNSKVDAKKALFDVEVGIMEPDALAAESGSIILFDFDATKSFVAFLPEIFIAIADESLMYDTVPEAVGALTKKHNRLPATIQIVNGPSRTGDIENKIVRPSHGPKDAYLIMVR